MPVLTRFSKCYQSTNQNCVLCAEEGELYIRHLFRHQGLIQGSTVAGPWHDPKLGNTPPSSTNTDVIG